MKDAMILLFYLLAVIARLLQPGGGRTIVAENLLLKQQLLLHSRSRSRAPNLSTLDRVLLGFWTLFLNPRRITRVGNAIVAVCLNCLWQLELAIRHGQGDLRLLIKNPDVISSVFDFVSTT